MNKKLIIGCVVVFLLHHSMEIRATEPVYKDMNAPLENRVNDLISRMTLEEKISQLVHSAKAIPRLGVPEYNWWNECLHGVARAGIATVFPQAIGLAATWDSDLMYQTADVISTEARAKHHEFVRNNQHEAYQGLTFWSPNINIFRDPRWGRGQETYGEDPFLTARMGVAFIKGLQGDHPDYFKVIATPKHYAVHSGPEPSRHEFDAITDNRDLYETYLPAFEACIKEAGAYSVMCAYNRYNGKACCGSNQLLQKILRDDWDFDGYVVSDCGAIWDVYKTHKLVNTLPEAAALALEAGTDLNCGDSYNSLLEAVKSGLVSKSFVDLSLKRLFTARFKLGMFDAPEMVPYTQIPFEKNDCRKHRALSARVARESIVLLKNDQNILPLKKNTNKIFVVGPTADNLSALLGNYHGTPSKFVTPLQGIKNKVNADTRIVFEQGCNILSEGPFAEIISTGVFSFNGKPGLKAEYYKSRDLSGDPLVTRIDPFIRSNWVYGENIEGLGTENFSIRWTGTLTPPLSGEYEFDITGDDGYRVFINDSLIIDDWNIETSAMRTIKHTFTANKPYRFKLEYFQESGRADIELRWLKPDRNQQMDNITKIAKESDVIIFVGGITGRLEGEAMSVKFEGFEGGDRTNLQLPKSQHDLLKALYATGTPIVFVITTGSALSINWEQEHLPAIIQLWYPGQEGGTALADVLFGDYNPGGRLPVTFYKSVGQLPPFDDYAMEGRTYRYFRDVPLYSFGHGLSYTTFEYSNLKAPDTVTAGENVDIVVDVKNTGKHAGDEVVQLYVKDVSASVPVPIRSLQGFKRIHLNPGEKQQVTFHLTAKQFSLIDQNFERIIEPGEFEITVGGSLPEFVPAGIQVVSSKVTMVGDDFHID